MLFCLFATRLRFDVRSFVRPSSFLYCGRKWCEGGNTVFKFNHIFFVFCVFNLIYLLALWWANLSGGSHRHYHHPLEEKERPGFKGKRERKEKRWKRWQLVAVQAQLTPAQPESTISSTSELVILVSSCIIILLRPLSSKEAMLTVNYQWWWGTRCLRCDLFELLFSFICVSVLFFSLGYKFDSCSLSSFSLFLSVSLTADRQTDRRTGVFSFCLAHQVSTHTHIWNVLILWICNPFSSQLGPTFIVHTFRSNVFLLLFCQLCACFSSFCFRRHLQPKMINI